MAGLVSRDAAARVAVLGAVLVGAWAVPAGAQEAAAAPEAAPAQAQETQAPETQRYQPPQADAAQQPSPKADVADEPRAQTAGAGGGGGGGAGDRDCADFDTQQEAQEYFEEQGGGPDNNVDQLDEDGDGLACESLDGGAVPDGGPATGGGWLAAGDGAGTAAPLAVLALLLVAAAGVARTRPN